MKVTETRVALYDCLTGCCCWWSESCRLEKDAGACYDNVLRFYWSAADAECRPFTYGGCGGNENRFITADDCYDTCSQHDDDHRAYSPADCFLPVAEGHCDAAEVRWYFDADREDCSAFYYTGCGSNGNNFRDYEDCFAFCSSGVYCRKAPVLRMRSAIANDMI